MSDHRPRVVVTSRSFGVHSAEGIRILSDAGCIVDQRGAGAPWPEEALRELVRDADALIVGTDRVTRRVLEAGQRLRIVARYGVGVDSIDLDAAADLGVVVTSTPGANTEAVAEMTIALLLALWRGLVRADRSVRARRWEPMVGRQLWGKTLGIIGLGRIGRAVARLARALGIEVTAYDIAEDPAFARECGVRYCSLEELLKTADAVSVHTPLTPATHGMLGARELGWMRRDAVLINAARGGVVDDAALAEALVQGRLAGAAVDVFEQEPPWQNPLLTVENVLLTPHIAAHTSEALATMDSMVASDVVAVMRGKPPAHPVLRTS